MSRLLLLYGLFCFFVAGTVGCRTATDNQIDLLERELRTQEDYIYELEDYVLDYSEKLRESRSMQPYVIESSTKSNEPSSNEPMLAPAKPAKKPVIEPPATEPVDDLPEPDPQPIESEQVAPEDIEIPDLEFDEPEPLNEGDQSSLDSPVQEAWDESNDVEFAVEYVEEEGMQEELERDSEIVYVDEEGKEVSHEEIYEEDFELVASTDDASGESPLSEAEFLEKLFEEEIPEESPAPEHRHPKHRHVERLVIVGVYRADDAATAPTSLMTVVEARDENNEPVDLDGRVSLMVMTADSEAPQRLKRWDFSADETASAWQSSPLGDGLHLELPLDELEATEGTELWVRLVGSDGRKFLDQLPLEWEQLISVVDAMETQPLSAGEQQRMVESNALPLADEPAKQPVEVSQRVGKTSTKWRTSMQRTHPTNDGFATTSPVSRGWTSQPVGGREPRTAGAGVKRFSSTVRQATATPVGSGSNKTDRPRWSPPRGRVEQR